MALAELPCSLARTFIDSLPDSIPLGVSAGNLIPCNRFLFCVNCWYGFYFSQLRPLVQAGWRQQGDFHLSVRVENKSGIKNKASARHNLSQWGHDS